jgi:hypothetical protein
MGRGVRNVAQVAGLVGKLHQRGPFTLVRRMFDLEFLTTLLGQRLIVGDLKHDAGDLIAKAFAQLGSRGIRIFDGVVQDGCLKDGQILSENLTGLAAAA